MANYIYETHRMNNPLLPFIFHRNMTVSQRHSLPNWHENIELLYCIGGRGHVQCGPDIFDFSPGVIFVVNPNTPHCIASESSVQYRCLIIDSTFCADNGIPIAALQFQNTVADDRIRTRFEQVCAAFDRYDDRNFCAAGEIRHAVLGLLLELCRSYSHPAAQEAGSPANEHVKKALTYIRQNISGTITLDAVAAYVGISKYHLSREFKAFTGSTVVQTVNLLRCAEAKGLMEAGMRVSAAAVSCGFENMSYFTRTFRKIYGTLPSDCCRPGTRTPARKGPTPESC